MVSDTQWTRQLVLWNKSPRIVFIDIAAPGINNNHPVSIIYFPSLVVLIPLSLRWFIIQMFLNKKPETLKAEAKAFDAMRQLRPFFDGPLANLPPRFRELEDRGYMVIPDVVDSATCDKLMAGLKHWLVEIGTGVNFKDRSTWRSAQLPYSIHNIFQQYQAGHIPPVWELRQDERVVQVFSDMWNTPARDLLTSFDGFCLRPPHEWLGRKGHVPGKTDGNWYHYDQGNYTGRHTIQGFITLEDQDKYDAPLMVIDKSHLHHSRFFQQFPGKKGDWIKFDDKELDWVLSQPDAKEVRVAAKKGSMVLWDSRTAHCAGQAIDGRPVPRWRGVIYTCYAPRKLASAKDLVKKVQAFEDMRTTNHHPAQNIHLFPARPRWGKDPSEFKLRQKPVDLTPLGRRLAGFDL